MKSIKLLSTITFAFLMLISVSAQKTDKAKKSKVPVRGNCEMCETTIENAALEIDGVQKADWDAEQELLTVVYDPKKTTMKEVEEHVSQAGYDTKNFVADPDVYNALPKCCQYDDKKEPKAEK